MGLVLICDWFWYGFGYEFENKNWVWVHALGMGLYECLYIWLGLDVLFYYGIGFVTNNLYAKFKKKLFILKKFKLNLLLIYSCI